MIVYMQRTLELINQTHPEIAKQIVQNSDAFETESGEYYFILKETE